MTLPLVIFWWFVKDIDQKYDWFLFKDFSQSPKWYVHYTAYHIDNIIKTWIVYLLCSKFLSKNIANISLAFLGLAIFRLAEYWLFRHSVPMIPIIAVMLVYCLYVFSKNDGR